MKKLLLLAAAVAAAVYAVNKQKQQLQKPDAWADASDSV